MSTVTIEFSVPITGVIDPNGRESRAKVKAKAKRLRAEAAYWSEMARGQARVLGVAMERAELTVSAGWPLSGRASTSGNVNSILEPVIEGCVDAKIVRGSDSGHLLKVTTQTYGRSTPGLLWLRLEFTDADS